MSVLNEVTDAMMDEISRARKDIKGIDWQNLAPHGRLKNGRSFAVPVFAIFGPNEIDSDEEMGRYDGTLIIEIRDGKLSDYSVGDWEKTEQDNHD